MKPHQIVAVAALVLNLASAGRAGEPEILPSATVSLDQLGTFVLYKDSDPGEHTLYVQPSNLEIARYPDGKPKVKIVMVRDFVGDSSGGPKTTSWGHIVISANIGYSKQDQVFSALRAKLDEVYPQFKTWKLSSLGLRPGTGELGIEVLESPNSSAPLGSTRQTWFPYGVSTVIGSELTAQVPITKEQAEIIRQTLLAGDSSTAELQVKLLYRANATFSVKPCTITVVGHADQFYSYFHEKFGTSGGVWIFSWNYQREKLVEDFRKSRTIETTVEMGDPELRDLADKYINVGEITKRYEGDAVEYLSGIEVDRTGKVPDNSYEKRVGHTTIFSPNFYWTYTAWAGGGYGKTEIERRAEGDYKRSITLKGSVLKTIAMNQDNVIIKKDAFQLVDLNQAAYIADTLIVDTFQLDEDAGKIFPRWIRSVRVIGELPGGNNLVYYFNRDRADSKSSVFFREAVMTKGSDGELRMSVPNITLRAELDGGSFRLVTDPRPFRRTVDRFTTNITSLSEFFNTVVIDGSVWFGLQENPTNVMLEVKVHRADQTADQVFYLKSSNPYGWVVYDKTKGLPESWLQIKLVDGIQDHPWGPKTEMTAGQDRYIILKPQVGVAQPH